MTKKVSVFFLFRELSRGERQQGKSLKYTFEPRTDNVGCAGRARYRAESRTHKGVRREARANRGGNTIFRPRLTSGTFIFI